jgi:RNA polymerase sigma factor (sigma-70 family)
MADASLGVIVRYLHKLSLSEGARSLHDEELLNRFARAGDEAAFESLVRRHGGLVYSLCRAILRNEKDAEDAFQAVFLTLSRTPPRSIRNGSLGGWLHQVSCRIAIRLRIKVQKRSARERDELGAAEMAVARNVVEFEQRDLLRAVVEELHLLPARYRDPVISCYLQGKTHIETAQELGEPVGSMSRTLARGCQLLRARLARRGISLSAGALAAILAGKAQAAVSPHLIQSALTAAGRFSRGLPVGDPSFRLARSLARISFLSQISIPAGILVVICALAAGAAGLGRHGQAGLIPSLNAGDPADRLGPAALERNRQARAEVIEQPPVLSATKLELQFSGLRGLSASPDGQRFVVSGARGALQLGSQPLGVFQQVSQQIQSPMSAKQNDIIQCAAYSPDGQTIATGNLDGEVKLWDAATSQERATVRGKGKPVRGVLFAGDHTVAIAVSVYEPGMENRDEMREVELWDLTSVSKRATLPGAEIPLAVSRNGSLLASGTMEWNICIWDVKTAKPIRTLEGHPTATKFVGFLPNGRDLASAGFDVNLKTRSCTNEVKLWDVQTGKAQLVVTNRPDYSWRGALSPDGRIIAIGYVRNNGKNYRQGNAYVTLLETKTGQVRARMNVNDEEISALSFSADGKTLAGIAEAKTLYLWDVQHVLHKN